eukprot:12431521-Karenia_brevis.AAC.2
MQSSHMSHDSHKAQSAGVQAMEHYFQPLQCPQHSIWQPLIGQRGWSETTLRLALSVFLRNAAGLFLRFVRELQQWPWRLAIFVLEDSASAGAGAGMYIQVQGRAHRDVEVYGHREMQWEVQQ